MEDQKELSVLKGQVSRLENQVNSIVIDSPETYAQAIDVVSKLKTIATTLKDRKEAITKPLNEALKSARELFTPVELQYSNAESIIKNKIVTYKRKVDEEARIAEAKIAEKVESGKMSVETAGKKMENLEKVDTTTRGKVGEVQIKKIKKVRITNESLIPREYLITNDVLIRKQALAGIEIPGVEVYEEESVAVK